MKNLQVFSILIWKNLLGSICLCDNVMIDDKNLTRKALVSITIEKSLLQVGRPVYDKVIKDLKTKYDCYLPDCYEHPEYLSEILDNLYGNSHKIIVESINKELREFSEYDEIASFLKVVCK